VLDFDPTDDTYYQVNNQPLTIVGGQWIQENKPIGDPSDDIGTVYTIVVLRVSEACSEQLAAAKPDQSNTVKFNPLPPGCPTREDEANARVVDVVNAGP
jgi:hypothetical protein